MYPVMLNLRGRRALVVGGGEIALRKIEGLLAEGALPCVVAPEVVPAIDELARLLARAPHFAPGVYSALAGFVDR